MNKRLKASYLKTMIRLVERNYFRIEIRLTEYADKPPIDQEIRRDELKDKLESLQTQLRSIEENLPDEPSPNGTKKSQIVLLVIFLGVVIIILARDGLLALFRDRPLEGVDQTSSILEITPQPTLTNTSLPTLTQTPTLTSTIDRTCRVTIITDDLNFRTGPGVAYPRLRTFTKGTEATVVGRLVDNSWWYINYEGTPGWISGCCGYVELRGSCEVSIVNPPPLPPTSVPTPLPFPVETPTFTLSSQGFVELVASVSANPCVGQEGALVIIAITNYGDANSGPFSNSFELLGADTWAKFQTYVASGLIALPDMNISPGLMPGETRRITLALGSFSAPGDQDVYIEFVVDSGSTIAERDEANNSIISKISC